VAEARLVRIEARLDLVRQLGEVAQAEAVRAGMSEAQAMEIELAVVEASNNVVAHGYSSSPGWIEMRVVPEAEGLCVELLDRGSPIPAGLLDDPPEVAIDAERGRGLSIIRACVDRVQYASEDGVNRLTLFKAKG
jgi:anti-sigma regulatory factor (Ser/Thr protein kinase)